MRILFITLFFPPTHNSGTENYTLGVAKAFLSRNHEVHVLCAGDWETGQDYWNGVTEERYEDVPVYRIQLNWMKAHNPNQALYTSPPVEQWVDRFLQTLKPDIVHITSAITLGVGIFRSVQRAGIPLVLTLTDFWFICPTIQLLRRDGSLCNGKTTPWECQSCLSGSSHLMQRVNRILPELAYRAMWGRLAKLPVLTKHRGLRGILLDMEERKQVLTQALSIPNRIFAPSKFVQQLFTDNTSLPIELLRHGQDLGWLINYKGKTDSDKLRFGYIGQIQSIKGVHILIEAFQKAGVSEHAYLHIWGDLDKASGYVDRLRSLIDDTSSIHLRGRFEHAQLATVLADIDVLVVPSLWYENAPLVIQEAFATKTPVVATRLGGMAEAVSHAVSGLLFERGNVDDLGKQLHRLIEEPDLLERLRSNIPRVRTADDEVAELETIYLDLVRQKVAL